MSPSILFKIDELRGQMPRSRYIEGLVKKGIENECTSDGEGGK
jgi:hypothetical protein